MIEKSGEKYLVKTSKNTHTAVINSIETILRELEGELQTRTGFTNEEYLELLDKSREKFTDLSRDELIMVHQALNEVCNGLRLENFELVLGANRAELLDLLAETSKLLD